MRTGRTRRWALVVLLVAGLAALPVAIGEVPASGSAIGAATLLSRIQSSAKIGYSGYAESTGDLALPVTTGQFASIADLFGSTTQLRIWWRGNQDWRVDQVTASGETDLHGTGPSVWTWDYEANTATLDQSAAALAARLPRGDDLVPANLARRLLSQARPAEVQRIASKRIAAQSAAGLRYVPATPESTIARVDVWSLAGSGLPVAVDVYAKGDETPVVSTVLLDLQVGPPAPSTTAFAPPSGANTRQQGAPDLLALASRFGPVRLPSELGGLRLDPTINANGVGVYGEGVTVLIAFPVFGRTGDQLRGQLTKAVGSTTGPNGVTAAVGPVNLLLSRPVSSAGFPRAITWLVVGTVTAPALEQAATDLLAEGP